MSEAESYNSSDHESENEIEVVDPGMQVEEELQPNETIRNSDEPFLEIRQVF